MQESCGDQLMELPITVRGEPVLVPQAVLGGVLVCGELLIKFVTKPFGFPGAKPFPVLGRDFRRFLELLRNGICFELAYHSGFGELLSDAFVGQQLSMLLDELFHSAPELHHLILLTGDHRKGDKEDNHIQRHDRERNPRQPADG